ncbi:Gluconolactonase [Cytospora mali]|uniref:Gluconolactonase n=1 Tax=Cytospora mali TaxID=578113 RepID=A0A194VVW5_CYTMA|nr:Gluconolactonase [Valsa mali]
MQCKLLTAPSRGNILAPDSSPSPTKEDEPVISLYQPTSSTEFDPRCRHSLLLSTFETSRQPLFHQACIYLPKHDELYITSNLLQTTSSSALPIVLISRVKLNRRSNGSESDEIGGSVDDVVSVDWQKLRPPQSMTMPAGGTAYEKGMVFCSQGNLVQGTGGLYYMPRGKPPEALVTGFYGRDFNSPHDVTLTKDGALWFTDPCHGFEEGIRKRPVLPCHTYRYQPATGDLRVMADGLMRPTGIAFSPDESTAYITDTDAFRGNGDQDLNRAATIYAFDVIMRTSSPFLTNKRVFAVPIKGVPVGIKCDERGYVYAGCADGIEVWNSGGIHQAVIEIPGKLMISKKFSVLNRPRLAEECGLLSNRQPGGVTNFCFGRYDEKRREIFVCSEQRLWRLHFGCHGDP